MVDLTTAGSNFLKPDLEAILELFLLFKKWRFKIKDGINKKGNSIVSQHVFIMKIFKNQA